MMVVTILIVDLMNRQQFNNHFAYSLMPDYKVDAEGRAPRHLPKSSPLVRQPRRDSVPLCRNIPNVFGKLLSAVSERDRSRK
jgi:hypothetical protein